MSEPLILDGSKIGYHQDRLELWRQGKRFAPLTVDMALTQACNFRCRYCYATLQRQDEHFPINKQVMTDFIDDAAQIGVKAISLVSDGESTINPAYVHTIQYGASKGIDMASGTNAYLLKETKLKEIMPHLTYLRVNITAGEPGRYKEIMGVKDGWFEQVCDNIKTMMRLKKENGWKCTVGMQAVLMPEFRDQIIPLAKLAKELKPDYLVLKHCSDDEFGNLGVDYSKYDQEMIELLKQAEKMSDKETFIKVKWNKINDGNKRSYRKCFGAAFHLQISGSGLVAPCGMMFADKYKRYHIDYITKTRFKDIVFSDRYWEVMDHLASDHFNAQKECGSLCLQHLHNKILDKERKGEGRIIKPSDDFPSHGNFI